MAKLEQVLLIDPPHELTFTGPFNSVVSSIMMLSNPSDRKVCFKLKTTAPKKYCVKPNSGVIDSKKTVQITVSLQPFEYDPNDKNRHKFMVQSMFAPDGEINQDTLWKETASNQLMDSKLKCVFLMPDENSSPASNGNDYASVNAEPSVANSSTKGDPQSSVTKVNLEGHGDINLKKSVEEIKKLQEEISGLRRDNIQLKEEALRQKRLAAAASSSMAHRPEMSSSSNSNDVLSVNVVSPDHNALSATYLYAAFFIFILGIVIGKLFL